MLPSSVSASSVVLVVSRMGGNVKYVSSYFFVEKLLRFLAQEMQEKCPECVVEKGDYLAVDYSRLPEKVQARIEELR